MIEVVPAATPVARPVAEIVAVAGVPEFQVTLDEMSETEPSLNVPVAVNCCVLPTFKWVGFAGVTAIDCNANTVSVTPGEVTVPWLAVIEVVPAATPVASPVAEIVAVAGVPEFQVTLDEMSDIEPSLNVPVAVNCCVLPTFKWAGLAGVTAIDESVFPPGGFIPLQPARTAKANTDSMRAAKRRGRDFISPPQDWKQRVFGGIPTY